MDYEGMILETAARIITSGDPLAEARLAHILGIGEEHVPEFVESVMGPAWWESHGNRLFGVDGPYLT